MHSPQRFIKGVCHVIDTILQHIHLEETLPGEKHQHRALVRKVKHLYYISPLVHTPRQCSPFLYAS